MIGDNLGLIEMFLSAALVLAFCGYQYWQVRDAGKKPDDTSDSK